MCCKLFYHPKRTLLLWTTKKEKQKSNNFSKDESKFFFLFKFHYSGGKREGRKELLHISTWLHSTMCTGVRVRPIWIIMRICAHFAHVVKIRVWLLSVIRNEQTKQWRKERKEKKNTSGKNRKYSLFLPHSKIDAHVNWRILVLNTHKIQ